MPVSAIQQVSDMNFAMLTTYAPSQRSDLWFERFQPFAKYNGWFEKKAFLAFSMKLMGSCEIWFDKLPNGS